VTKNADHYFKCIVPDELRMFRDTSKEGIGLYVCLRNFSFDSDPIGFLVDHHHRPFDSRRLADAVGEKNARFSALFDEIRQQKLIQTVPEFASFLGRLASRNRRANRKLALFQELVVGVWPDGPMALDDVCLVPQLLDQRLDSLYGQRTGKLANAAAEGADVVLGLVYQGGVPPSPPTLVHPQRSESEVRGQSQNLKKEISHETRATKLPSPARFDFVVEQVRQFHADRVVLEMRAADPDEYAREFELRIGYAPAEFEELRERMAIARRPAVSAYVVRMPSKRKARRRSDVQLQLMPGGRS